MPEYIPSTRDWVREQVALYESSGGAQGTTLRDTGLPVIVVTNRGNRTGAVRKTPLMRVKDGDNYILVGSQGGAPKNPVWVYNLRAPRRRQHPGRNGNPADASAGGRRPSRARPPLAAGRGRLPAL